MFDITGAPWETSGQVISKYLNRVSSYINEHRDISLIRGIGWNRAFFSGGCADPKWPTRHDLDAICNDRPVVLESYCQHAIWVNTKAIEMAGLSAETKDPSSGEFTREDSGYPAGMFFEIEAQKLIKENRKNYDFTVSQYKTTILKYQKELANNYGVTLINDCFHTENAKQAYKELAEAGELTLRVRGVYNYENCQDLTWPRRISKQRAEDCINDTFSIDTVKIFVEGEFAMIEPYTDAFNRQNGNPDGYCGSPFYSDHVLNEAVLEAMKTGMQIHVHAMGDRAVRQAIESIRYGQEKTGMRNRNVIAHLMAVKEEDIGKLAENDIICNCQPRWMIYDSDAKDNYELMFGPVRAREIYPNRSFVEAGCIVSYGTDFPVTPPPNPFHGIQCAVTRSVFEGDEREYEVYKDMILGPYDNPKKECVSLKDAVKSSAYNGAYQNFLEDITGSIEEGKSADFAVLDCDLESISPEEIYKTEVCWTVFKGNIVYKRS